MVAEDDGHRIKMPTAMMAVADKAHPRTNQDLPITIVAAGLLLSPRQIPERVSITAEGDVVIPRRSIPARRPTTSTRRPPYLIPPPSRHWLHLRPDTPHRPLLPVEGVGPSRPTRRHPRHSRHPAVAGVLMTEPCRLCLVVFSWI